MRVVFTDLDGTLLDSHTYSFQPALPALERMRAARTPLIPVTSKTRAEVEIWRRRLQTSDPFIVENGGAVFVPPGCFTIPLEAAENRDGYLVLELGERYERLVDALRCAVRETGCQVAAFHAMSDQEVAERCSLPIEQARLAKAREYDEAFTILDEPRARTLLDALERRGLRWTRGGRFHHVMGGSDKARAVALARDLYAREHGPVVTIGLGDAPNDAGFLKVVDWPVVIRSRLAEKMRELVPRGRVTSLEGPAGWNEAILDLVPG
jgi:mannosyl-3-phosphoglycerate phosphatase